MSSSKDGLRWKLEASGFFSTKFIFSKMTMGAAKANFSTVNLIWKLKISKKVKFFLWSLAYRSLNIQNKLQRKFPNGSLSPSICYLCLKEAEAFDHLFLHCDFAFKGWNRIFDLFALDDCLPKKIDDGMKDGLTGGSFGGKA